MQTSPFVPAKAGSQRKIILDSRLRGNERMGNHPGEDGAAQVA
jgi:hypothetical protein